MRDGDLTIIKMAVVRHLEFWKFAVYVTWPLSLCYSSSSPRKTILKSDNPRLSYGQKS